MKLLGNRNSMVLHVNNNTIVCAKYCNITLQHLQYEIIDNILYKILRHLIFLCLQITYFTHAKSFVQFVNRQIAECYCECITLISEVFRLTFTLQLR